MFEVLRDEIVNDDLLAGQPEASKQWVAKVRLPAGRWEGSQPMGWPRCGWLRGGGHGY